MDQKYRSRGNSECMCCFVLSPIQRWPLPSHRVFFCVFCHHTSRAPIDWFWKSGWLFHKSTLCTRIVLLPQWEQNAYGGVSTNSRLVRKIESQNQSITSGAVTGGGLSFFFGAVVRFSTVSKKKTVKIKKVKLFFYIGDTRALFFPAKNFAAKIKIFVFLEVRVNLSRLTKWIDQEHSRESESSPQ